MPPPPAVARPPVIKRNSSCVYLDLELCWHDDTAVLPLSVSPLAVNCNAVFDAILTDIDRLCVFVCECLFYSFFLFVILLGVDGEDTRDELEGWVAAFVGRGGGECRIQGEAPMVRCLGVLLVSVVVVHGDDTRQLSEIADTAAV